MIASRIAACMRSSHTSSFCCFAKCSELEKGGGKRKREMPLRHNKKQSSSNQLKIIWVYQWGYLNAK